MKLNKIRIFSGYGILFPMSGLGVLILLSGWLSSCNSVYTPKRRGYFKIDFPPHQYQTFDQKGFPYSFEYPVYANIVRDTSFFEAAPENPWWINIDFPRFNARIYISYKEIGPNSFDKLREDTYKMTFKHAYKAASIDQTPIQTPNGVGGVFFNVGGNAATANQFFLTDTTKHFLRAALYFNVAPNEDSLGIVNQFLQKDIVHLINTFRWKETGVEHSNGKATEKLRNAGTEKLRDAGTKNE